MTNKVNYAKNSEFSMEKTKKVANFREVRKKRGIFEIRSERRYFREKKMQNYEFSKKKAKKWDILGEK